MIEILSGVSSVMKICGKQEKKASTDYRLSKYCVQITCEDGILLYHTLTGGLFMMPYGETIESNEEILLQEWFLVPVTFDEKIQTDEIRQIAGLLGKKTGIINGFTIVTTTDCNARCFYCYEHGMPRFSMSEKTARDTAEYIIHRSKGEPVKFSWFGGEPLYNIPAIDIICEELRKAQIAVTSSMVSNCFFLDKKVVQRARSLWNLERIQVTIDGTEKKYNQTKAFINTSENGFERVLQNIGYALDAGIRILVRMHMASPDTGDLEKLADLLTDRFQGKAGLTAFVSLVMDSKGEAMSFPEVSDARKPYERITGKLIDNGIFQIGELKRDLLLTKCKADNDLCETIYPDGTIGKCENYDEAEIIGSIYQDDRNEYIANTWKERRQVPECADCALYPHCIRLKKCMWDSDKCSEFNREKKLSIIKEQILQLYHERKRNLSSGEGSII